MGAATISPEEIIGFYFSRDGLSWTKQPVLTNPYMPANVGTISYVSGGFYWCFSVFY